MEDKTCCDFLRELSSKEPTPGGGGAAAFVGAVGASLGSMVGNLTLGKKKYASVEKDISVLLEENQRISDRLLQLVKDDAEGFKPLASAYKIPKTDPDRDHILEMALLQACQVPLEIMETALEGLSIQRELADKGNMMAVSDVGVGVQFLRAAVLGASLNVYINVKLMKNKAMAESLSEKTKQLEIRGEVLADSVYGNVRRKLQCDC